MAHGEPVQYPATDLGEPANPWQGVRWHAVKPDPPEVPTMDTNHGPSQAHGTQSVPGERRGHRTKMPPTKTAATTGCGENGSERPRTRGSPPPTRGVTHAPRNTGGTRADNRASPPQYNRGREHPNQRVNDNAPSPPNHSKPKEGRGRKAQGAMKAPPSQADRTKK